MKKIILIAILSCIGFITISAQVYTTIPNKCHIFQGYYSGGFKVKKKVKSGSEIILKDTFAALDGYYEIFYKGDEYIIKGENIDENDLSILLNEKEKSRKREQFIEDSIRVVEREKRIEERRKKQAKIDSINKKKNYLLDSLKIDLAASKNAAMKVLELKEDSLLKLGYPIIIKYCYVGEPNSAGGCDLCISFKNIATKDIKYIHLSGYVINAVNDKAYCTIRNYSATTVTGIGPIEPRTTASYSWDNVWYNHTVNTFIPTQIKIEYMKGGYIVIGQQKIKKVIELPPYEELVEEILKRRKSTYDKYVDKVEKHDFNL